MRPWSGRSIFSNTDLIRCFILGYGQNKTYERNKSYERNFRSYPRGRARLGPVDRRRRLHPDRRPTLGRSAGRIGTGNGRMGAIVALVAGLIAVVNGGLVLATADGGPGTGNGVVGAIVALVLGVIGMVLGRQALARSRRSG